MAYNWKKQATAAYAYALIRLALNIYVFFEAFPDLGKQDFVRPECERFVELLASWLSGDPVEDSVMQLRCRNTEQMEEIIGLADSFRIYEYALNRVERRYVDDAPDITMTQEEFIASIMDYLTAAGNGSAMNRRIQQVVGQLPVRFTRQKFYSMVQESLSIYVGSQKASLDGILYMLQSCGIARLTEEQWARHPGMAASLKQLKELDFKNMTADTFRQAQGMVLEAGKELGVMADLNRMLQEMTNDLLILVLTGKDAMVDEKDALHARRILNGICGLYQNGSSEIPQELDDSLYELEGVQEEWHDRLQRLDPAPAFKEGEGQAAALGRRVEKLLSSSTFAELEDKAETQVVSQEDVEQAVEQLVSALDPVLRSVQKPVMRAIMSLVLSELPLCFNSLSEIRQYVENSLPSCGDLAETESSVELLLTIMEMDGYEML